MGMGNTKCNRNYFGPIDEYDKSIQPKERLKKKLKRAFLLLNLNIIRKMRNNSTTHYAHTLNYKLKLVSSITENITVL
ncbi:hypothetical protein BS101_14315 [Clostridium kluyveri]|uniref:Uncharacterized protein n=1 Tax=Clostridium kluyveri TaxID=1534 RepID=A0A1L5F9Y7_CLOKL|nr:hypothetical protein BS101_14315 [Clostridium kluyveri]